MASRTLRSSKPKVGRPKGKLTQHKRLDRLKSALERTPAGVTMKDLARIANVTERSVRRYLLELKDAWDLEAVRVAPGGAALWRIKPSERGRSVLLRRAQALAVLGASSVLDDLGDNAITEDTSAARDQLRQIVDRPLRRSVRDAGAARAPQRFIVYRPTDRAPKLAREVLDEIYAAIVHSTLVSLRLRDAKGESRRFVPWSLLAHAETMHLAGIWEHGEEPTLIDLAQVSVARAAQDAPAKPPSDNELRVFFHGVMGVSVPARFELAVIEIDADSTQAYRGVRVHPAQKVLLSKDGRMRLTVPLVDPEKLLRWVLAQAGAAHVVGPPELVAAAKESLARAVAKYGP